ncbi:PhoX family protein [Plesiomonas sp.]|uniref:PhoX family protein n=1 Tax=Plesiomonas sp. TaxID=2486279 RepID=UPI003F316E3F
MSFKESRNDKSTKDVAFDAVLSHSINRRNVLKGAFGATATLFFASNSLTDAFAKSKVSALLNFKPVPASTLDTIVVPEGYSFKPLISWGDPIIKGAAAFNQSLNSAEEQLGQFGDNNDGMSFFHFTNEKGELNPNRALMAINNEYYQPFIFPHQTAKIKNIDNLKKAQAASGVSIIEVVRDSKNQWRYVPDSKFNRRIHANTPMEITGAVRGSDSLKSTLHTDGVHASGTINNCSNGRTPWGTYLTCEENFNVYFGATDEFIPTPAQKRYGLSAKSEPGREWGEFDSRFDLTKNPNEANTFGWVVEIDPFDPTSVPKKRTALGRFMHENAAVVINKDGHVVVYMGDDDRGEFMYKFVSEDVFDASNPFAKSNRDLLEKGTLYVAQFEGSENKNSVNAPMGTGRWLPLIWNEKGLTPDNGFHSQADVLINARLAGTIVGATTMDRPEWVAINPLTGDIFTTLTNNKNRGVNDNQAINAPNPRAENHYGQIIRLSLLNKDHASDVFSWDLFLLAGNPMVHKGTPYAGSHNITSENMFNSPDGIGFDKAGRLWIQTDGNYSNKGDFKGMGNNQMLCADPNTGEVKRFLTGPTACEITGLAFSDDQKTMFINVQHPGEDSVSTFPHGIKGNIPRSSVIMITKNDNGVIGD